MNISDKDHSGIDMKIMILIFLWLPTHRIFYYVPCQIKMFNERAANNMFDANRSLDVISSASNKRC